MSAQPIDYHHSDDLVVTILRTLTEPARPLFLREFELAALEADDAAGRQALADLLHNWMGRAVAMSRPGFAAARAAAARPADSDVPLAVLDAELRAS
jgi:hypothetical protein